MDDDYCEICGEGGDVVEVVILDSRGAHVIAVVHIVCEGSRRGKDLMRRVKAPYN